MTTITVELIAETCCSCGAIFGMTKEHISSLKGNGNLFYCPNGHPQHYTQSDAVKIKELEKKLRQEKETAEYWRKSYRGEQDDHEGTKRRLSATKGALTKTRKRISNGTCPCCHRHFTQLERHMKSKHPDYQEDDNG